MSEQETSTMTTTETDPLAALTEEQRAAVDDLLTLRTREITDQMCERLTPIAPSTLTPEKAEQLRKPFAPEQIGKLPRLSCRDCQKADQSVCGKHQKSRCDDCHNWISNAHVHLDYVGHAAATDRLLQVDPLWTWEPVCWDPQGLPMIARSDKRWALWIRLTICGVTRLGVGTCESNKFEPEKELIGDAIRNAAMRFGVALDLWAKEDLHAKAQDAETPPAQSSGGAPPEPTDADLIRAVSTRREALAEERRAEFDAFKAELAPPWPWPIAACRIMLRRLDDLGAPVPIQGERDTATGTDQTPPPAATTSEPGEGLPPADNLPVDGPCEICGSTRAAKALVNGVRRCRNANDCRKRAEERDADAAGDPLPAEPTASEDAERAAEEPYEPVQHSIPTDGPPGPEAAETGDETLVCVECKGPIVDELPIFGDHDEPRHAICAGEPF